MNEYKGSSNSANLDANENNAYEGEKGTTGEMGIYNFSISNLYKSLNRGIKKH